MSKWISPHAKDKFWCTLYTVVRKELDFTGLRNFMPTFSTLSHEAAEKHKAAYCHLYSKLGLFIPGSRVVQRRLRDTGGQ
jgi:hypothetical protein